MPVYDLRTGHTLKLLRAMPSDFVQTCVTSIPYYGLRDYQIEPDVWDGHEFCEHDFFDLGSTRPKPDRSTVWKSANGSGVFGGGRGEQKTKAARGAAKPLGGMCQFCGAWLGHLGLEPTPELFIEHVVKVFREVRRVLRKDGTLWLNIGDSFANDNKWGGHSGNKNSHSKQGALPRARRVTGYKPKDLMMMPHRVALALQADGWWVRMDNVWSKPAPLPESVNDRPTKSHEYVFLLTKSPDYYYDPEPVREKQTGNAHSRGKGVTPKSVPHDTFIRANDSFNAATAQFIEAPDGKRNLRSVWTINSQPFPEAHFATFPPALPERCIKAGTSEMGACVECVAPWKRVFEKVFDGSRPQTKRALELFAQAGLTPDHLAAVRAVGITDTGKTAATQNGTGKNKDSMLRLAGEVKDALNGYYRELLLSKEVTLGWQPTCTCFGEQFVEDPHAPLNLVRPCVVLDPFSGAGTTGLVALRLGRDYVGHERGPQYVEMSRRRIHGDAPMYFREGLLY